jgi:hypothetical protein
LLSVSLLAAWVGLIGAAGCEERRTSPAKGEACYLEGKGGAAVYVSVDATTHEQVAIFLAANNEGAVRNLINQDRVIVCEKGTRVTVVEPGGAASTVRITSGTHSGKTGLVANECLHRIASR